MTAPAHATPFDALADAVSQALVILLNLDSFGATPTGIADALTAASEAGRALDRARRAAVDADRESGSAVLHLTAEESEVLNRALTPGLARDLSDQWYSARHAVGSIRSKLRRSVSRRAEAASILAEAERHASTPTERACAACGRACDTIFSGVRVHAKCRDARARPGGEGAPRDVPARPGAARGGVGPLHRDVELPGNADGAAGRGRGGDRF